MLFCNLQKVLCELCLVALRSPEMMTNSKDGDVCLLENLTNTIDELARDRSEGILKQMFG